MITILMAFIRLWKRTEGFSWKPVQSEFSIKCARICIVLFQRSEAFLCQSCFSDVKIYWNRNLDFCFLNCSENLVCVFLSVCGFNCTQKYNFHGFFTKRQWLKRFQILWHTLRNITDFYGSRGKWTLSRHGKPRNISFSLVSYGYGKHHFNMVRLTIDMCFMQIQIIPFLKSQNTFVHV